MSNAQSNRKKKSPRNNASTFYANNSDRCSEIVQKGGARCKRPVQNGGNLCGLHNNLRKKKITEHNRIIKSRGGEKSRRGKKPIYEYDYYLDDEIEQFDSNASRVVPRIWIGSIDSANDVNYLSGNGIKSVINISGMEPSLKTRDMYRKLGIDYNTLSEIEKVPYKSHYRVSKYLGDEKFSRSGLTPRQFFKFMHKGSKIMNRKNFKFPALVHCHAGMNRSAALIAAYLTTKPRPYSYDRTIELLEKANKRRDLDVLTNNDFRRSLRYFPIFMGTQRNVSPKLLSKYKTYLKSYER